MNKTEINKEQIVTVTQKKFRKDKDIIYSEKKIKSYFFGLFVEAFDEGFHYKGHEWARPDLELNFYEVRGREVWLKPELIIQLSSGKTLVKLFNSDQEMLDWREENLKGINLIEI